MPKANKPESSNPLIAAGACQKHYPLVLTLGCCDDCDDTDWDTVRLAELRRNSPPRARGNNAVYERVSGPTPLPPNIVRPVPPSDYQFKLVEAVKAAESTVKSYDVPECQSNCKSYQAIKAKQLISVSGSKGKYTYKYRLPDDCLYEETHNNLSEMRNQKIIELQSDNEDLKRQIDSIGNRDVYEWNDLGYVVCSLD